MSCFESSGGTKDGTWEAMVKGRLWITIVEIGEVDEDGVIMSDVYVLRLSMIFHCVSVKVQQDTQDYHIPIETSKRFPGKCPIS